MILFLIFFNGNSNLHVYVYKYKISINIAARNPTKLELDVVSTYTVYTHTLTQYKV